MRDDQLEREVDRLRLERDLYLGLLDLNANTELQVFLREALRLMLGVAGAAQGYLEIFQDEGPGWWTSAGYSDDELIEVRSLVSQGIIAEAVASGKAVVTPSALLDPRFRDRGSVRRSRIEAVLCAPIGRDPPLGVLYLQGPTQSAPFREEDLSRAEIFGRHLAPLVHRVFESGRLADDYTKGVRRRLRADPVVGQSRAIAQVLEEAALVAPLDVSVLITGETGTGKSQLARVIHENSPRRSGALVELNCATIPEPLMESELFGALAGAHSTAAQRIVGKVSAADGGTLVLDEITELSVSAQAKLLQLLQTKEYYALGAAKPTLADIRLIAATNVDLQEAVRQRRFREDLYYRLQVVPIRMPPLAERRDDLEMLGRYFCEQACRRHGLKQVELSLGALRAIRTAPWRGNVRELAHVVEAGTIRAAGQDLPRVEAAHLFAGQAIPEEHASGRMTFQEETRRFQLELLKRTLEETDWNIAAAARELDLTRSHMYNLIKAYGLTRNAG